MIILEKTLINLVFKKEATKRMDEKLLSEELDISGIT
ncbi:hypothetical protein CM15mP35_03080 [bacterium]|nr:MAG: hypothetical protein CM15mP35_03080 [bacterium]